MVYLGSKNRVSKELAPIIQSYITENTVGYLEPFVGGANMIDKIDHHNRIGVDIHRELIALLNKAKDDADSIPSTISEYTYNEVKNNKSKFEDWYVGLVGFCATFSGKYFQGYAKANDKRDRQAEMIRNLKKQSVKLKNIEFINGNYLDLEVDKFKDYVVYCDAPYNVNAKYGHTGKFDYDKFYNWCRLMSKNNVVLISEYNMPSDFECIWEKKTKTIFNSHKNKIGENINRTEKLFKFIG